MEETQVAPDAATQNLAPVLAETPEVAAPESANPEAPVENPPEDDPRDKTVQSLQRRVNRVTAARYQEQARAQQLANEAEQLRQRLAQYEQQPQQPALTPEKVLPIAQQLAAQIREQEKVRDSVSSVLAKGRTLEGFDKACNAVAEEIPFYAQDGKPTDFLRVVLECDAPEKVLHYLGTNPDVASELADLSPTQVARRLDRIERDLAKPPEPKATTAPKPIQPVKTVARDDGSLSDELSTEEWIKRRNKQARG